MIYIGRTITLILLTLTIANSGLSQESKFSKKDFVAPVDIPMYLSGTFGELRSNHFHAGIDIKTQGVEGKVIRTINDGWVSRIKVSTSGYGKAIYITHPDGYISVYGHLQRFNDTIQSIVVNRQYEKESFTIQMFFDKNELTVKKGEIIAYSGNTGGSNGPHLHFEIRDERTQHPLNPLLFSTFKVKDFYRPKITHLAIYPVDKESLINGINDTLVLKVSGWGLEHKISLKDDIRVSGNISFGIGTYDLMNEIPNKNGVYSTKFYHDSTMIFDLEMNELSFKTTRYINSLIDYPFYKKSKKRIVRTQIDTNNMLSNYNQVVRNGIINIVDTMNHNFTFEVRDAYDNLSKLSIDVIGDYDDKESSGHDSNEQNDFTYFPYSQKNSIISDSLTAVFPENCFYQSFNFTFEKLGHDTLAYSQTYKLHNFYTPVHKHFKLSILPRDIDSTINEKTYIAYSTDNDNYYYLSSKKEGNMMIASSRSLGYYRIQVDTTAPIITEVNFKDGKNVSKQRNLKIKISDKQTGIDSYKAYLNDKWVLMEYEPKKKLLTYNYDDKLISGKNQFKLIVTDYLGNSTEYSSEIVY